MWKETDNGKIECIKKDICEDEGYNMLVDSNKKCTKNCPNNTFKFNHICYGSGKCPENTMEKGNECKCKNLWYKYTSEIYKEDFIYCLSDDIKECPYDTHPYLIKETNECVKDISSDFFNSFNIFNYILYNNTCPTNTKNKGDSKCECNEDKPWYQYIKNGKKYLECGIDKCPSNKGKLNNKTNECVSFCSPSQYYYKGDCYDVCPDNTKLIDSISRECTEFITFNEEDNLSNFDTLMTKDLTTKIYPLTSKGGIIYNINNSTLQIYGVNKKRTINHELIIFIPHSI